MILNREMFNVFIYPLQGSEFLVPTSYLGPALITGQDSSVQNSVIVPYNMFIWLKKSTVFTATHLKNVVMLFGIIFFLKSYSLMSSPSGNITANLRLPAQYTSTSDTHLWIYNMALVVIYMARKVKQNLKASLET